MKIIKIRINNKGDRSILVPKSFPEEVKEIYYTPEFLPDKIVFHSGCEPFTISDLKKSTPNI